MGEPWSGENFSRRWYPLHVAPQEDISRKEAKQTASNSYIEEAHLLLIHLLQSIAMMLMHELFFFSKQSNHYVKII